MSGGRPAEILQRVFGHSGFRGCQEEVIEHLLGDRHAMLVMPTGMGKSLCYQIPALTLEPGSGEIVVVLSPLIALMQDQVDSLNRKGVDAVFINSSLDRESRLRRYAEIVSGRYRLLYVTPERFRKEDFASAIARRKVRWLAVDEAHCVSEWGHDFRPDYTRLGEIREQLGCPTTIALTATATAECRCDIYRQLGIPADSIRLFHEGIERPNLRLDVLPVWDEEAKIGAVVEALRDAEFAGGKAIVYFSLIKTLERFAEALRSRGLRPVCYHGDLPRRQRRDVQDAFMLGDADLVLATNAFGMGVDREDIRWVIHAETPGSLEAYYQEIGRAGRDGRPSRCLWLYDQDDLMTQMQFIEWSNPDADYYSRLYDLLNGQRESCLAFGLEWVNERLQRLSRHDQRLGTALGMLHRYGAIRDRQPPGCFDVVASLPDALRDAEGLAEKKKGDQRRLYALVEYAAERDDRHGFFRRYFLGESRPDYRDRGDAEYS